MSSQQDLKSLSAEWSTAISSNDWQKAFDISVRGYRAATIAQDHVEIMMFLGFVRIASERLFENLSTRGKEANPGENRCSFCGESRKDLPIVAGAKVAICSKCVGMANEMLNDKKTSKISAFIKRIIGQNG